MRKLLSLIVIVIIVITLGCTSRSAQVELSFKISQIQDTDNVFYIFDTILYSRDSSRATFIKYAMPIEACRKSHDTLFIQRRYVDALNVEIKHLNYHTNNYE